MIRRSTAVAACFLLTATALSAQTFDPVPPEQVAGRRLIVPEANFSAEAPGDRWAWSVAIIPNGRMYACRRLSDDISFVVIHRADGRRRMSEHSLQTFLDGAVDALHEEGFSVSTLTRSDAAQPFPGSFHFRASLTEEHDSVNRLVGFAGARGDSYALTALIGSDADERLFTEFAQSFRLLESAPILRRFTLGLIILDGVLVVVAWLGFLGFERWGVNRRLLTLLAAVIALLVVLWVGLLARGVMVGTRTPDDLDRALGQIAGACMVAAAAGGIARAVRP